MLRLHPLAVSRICGTVIIEVASNGSKERVSIGLGIKFARRKLRILGYARRRRVNRGGTVREQWELSQRAIALLRRVRSEQPR